MKTRLTITFAAIIMLIAVSPASAYFYTMDFTNTTLDLGPSSQINLTNQYDAFGLNFHQVYRYSDPRDPWLEGFDAGWGADVGWGISNGFVAQGGTVAQLGTVFFNEATDSVGFDWWTIAGDVFNLTAYDAGGSILGSFAGSGFGSDKIVATGIAYLDFHNDGGHVQVANLSYERTRPVIPEPTTLALFGLGLLGAGVVRRMRK